ncbi:MULTISPECIES: hypothetical protein [Metallosphaera]|uniref:hypothetical protein n=1 Tax=Metallosphaera TaxID=41980 RepID=UPI001F05A220|nr:hypothetical protein [Metallosphaera sedula]MCH1772146.1 hypothetical protein [Metallosphaera sedula]MCP6727691.1 hypothetical protein [Metallosphaera sedula]
MQSTKAIADTSFIIDWTKYDKRDLLFKYYDIVFIAESVLNEIRTELPLIWISTWMSNGRVKVLEENAGVRNKALLVVDRTRELPVRSADYPEAVCVVLGKELSLDVLTENGGVFSALEIMEDYQGVRALRGIDVLYNLSKKGIIDFKSEVQNYMTMTKHTYTRELIRRYGIEV